MQRGSLPPELPWTHLERKHNAEETGNPGVVALLTARAAALAQKVSYDYDKTAKFADFKTYAHKEGTKVGQELIDERIVAAHRRRIGREGFTKADANPDLYVVYHVAFDKQKDISTYSSGYGGGYGAYGWG